ncbi:MAG: DUF4160 domain-containing protein [Ignavibacteriota bacterium]
MPKVLEINGFTFFFYSQEGNEPPHIHVRKAGNTAKFWLDPINLVENYGFSSSQMQFINSTIKDNHHLLIESWNEFFYGA